jgi:hypothetical protein
MAGFFSFSLATFPYLMSMRRLRPLSPNASITVLIVASLLAQLLMRSMSRRIVDILAAVGNGVWGKHTTFSHRGRDVGDEDWRANVAGIKWEGDAIGCISPRPLPARPFSASSLPPSMYVSPASSSPDLTALLAL